MNYLISIIDFTSPYTSNIFAKLIIWLVSVTSSVAASVILFTLFLKIITLPFDFMSRFSMRKNSIKMEQMRPELTESLSHLSHKTQDYMRRHSEVLHNRMAARYKAQYESFQKHRKHLTEEKDK